MSWGCQGAGRGCIGGWQEVYALRGQQEYWGIRGALGGLVGSVEVFGAVRGVEGVRVHGGLAGSVEMCKISKDLFTVLSEKCKPHLNEMILCQGCIVGLAGSVETQGPAGVWRNQMPLGASRGVGHHGSIGGLSVPKTHDKIYTMNDI